MTVKRQIIHQIERVGEQYHLSVLELLSQTLGVPAGKIPAPAAKCLTDVMRVSALTSPAALAYYFGYDEAQLFNLQQYVYNQKQKCI